MKMTMNIIVCDGKVVRDPKTGKKWKAGMNKMVPRNNYWLRRKADGEVDEVDKVKPKRKLDKKKKPESPPTPDEKKD